MPTSELITNMVVGGVLMGGLYALIAMGLSLQYGVARVLNLAHGDFLMLGGFAAISLHYTVGIHPLLSLAIVGPGLFVIGFFLHRTLFRSLFKSAPSFGAFEGSSLLATYGLLYVIQYAAKLGWGDLPQRLVFLNYPIFILGAVVFKNREVAFAIALGIGVAFYLFLSYTRMGKAIRAAAQDPTTAGLMGVNIDRMLALCFGLGALLTGFAAVLYVTCFPVLATIGLKYTLIAIIVVVLGGLGSIPGCFVGGFILGIVGNIIDWIQPALSLPAFYVIFIILLLVRPTGILGKR